MFNKDFYPTPRKVVETMLENEQIIGSVVLEPSAGKGNIVKVLQEFGANQILTCEIIEEFQPFLAKNSTFLKPDFMDVTAAEVAHVQFIIMNPPFSKDIEHIHHAYNIAPPGCTIISLCNSAKLNNRYYDRWYYIQMKKDARNGDDTELEKFRKETDRKQKFQKLVEDHGFETKLYDCFTEAERKAQVEVSKIVLFKEGNEDGLDFDVYMDHTMDENGSGKDGLISYNEVRECVNRYVAAVNKFNGMYKTISDMNTLTKEFGGSALKLEISHQKTVHSLASYKTHLQKEAWSWIFNKLRLEKFQTQKLRNQLNKFVELRQNYPFTVKNIYSVLDMIFQTHGQRMESTLVEAFDTICSFSSDNRTEYEGWKTNSAYKVNKQFIVPNVCNGYDYSGNAYTYVNISYHSSSRAEQINDIYKAICYMRGVDYDKIRGFTSFMSMWKDRMQWGKWYENGFFKVRCYKKGTVHFKFVDDKIWEQFNRRVAEIKGWVLPEKTDKKTTGRERSAQTTKTNTHQKNKTTPFVVNTKLLNAPKEYQTSMF